MSIEQNISKINLPKLLRRTPTDLLLFGWIQGIKWIRPEFNFKDALEGFMIRYNIDEDDYNTESAESRYYTMQKEFMELKKTKE